MFPNPSIRRTFLASFRHFWQSYANAPSGFVPALSIRRCVPPGPSPTLGTTSRRCREVGLFLHSRSIPSPALFCERRCQARFSRWLRCENRDWQMRAGRAARPVVEHHRCSRTPAFAGPFWLRFVTFGNLTRMRRVGLFLHFPFVAACPLRSLAGPRDHFSALPRSGFVSAFSIHPFSRSFLREKVPGAVLAMAAMREP